MKLLEEIIKQEPVFLNNWKSKFDVIANFEDIYLTEEGFNAKESPYPNEVYWLKSKEKMKAALEKYKNVHILFASYGYENYVGQAWVLFEQDGKLYEVNGGHCSCHGLEGQWEPEDVLLEELEHRLLNGTFGKNEYAGNEFHAELCEFLGIEVNKDE